MCTYTYYNLLDVPNIYTLHISRSFADVITRAHIRKPIIIPFLCITAAAMHLCARQIRFQHANLPSVIFHSLVVQFPITKPSSYIVAAISINAIHLDIIINECAIELNLQYNLYAYIMMYTIFMSV